VTLRNWSYPAGIAEEAPTIRCLINNRDSMSRNLVYFFI